MSSIIKVNTFQDANGNALFSSDGSGNVTTSASGLQNTPAFLAKLSADQSLPNTTATKIQFDSEDYDTDGAYDNTTNYRFTVPTGKGGKYCLYYVAHIDSGSVNSLTRCETYIYKNGTKISQFKIDPRSNTGTKFNLGQTVVLDLSASDYIEIFAFIDCSSGVSDIDKGETYDNYFGAYRIIGA
jgi:hypothetical protein